MSRWMLGSLVCAVAFGLVPGCSQSGALKTVTVTVTHKGQPVAGATVTFLAAAATPPASGGKDTATSQSRSGVGKTDANGRATMWTLTPGDGVAAGSYKVIVSKIVQPAPATITKEDFDKGKFAKPTPPTHELPKKYENPVTSGLTAEVSDRARDFTFDLPD